VDFPVFLATKNARGCKESGGLIARKAVRHVLSNIPIQWPLVYGEFRVRFPQSFIAAHLSYDFPHVKLSPSEILRAVTASAAEAICLSDRGVLQAGKRADLIVVEGDPLRDLTCLEKIRAVMKAGVWYRQ